MKHTHTAKKDVSTVTCKSCGWTGQAWLLLWKGLCNDCTFANTPDEPEAEQFDPADSGVDTCQNCGVFREEQDHVPCHICGCIPWGTD